MAATLQKVQELLSTHQTHQPSVLTFQHEVEVLIEDIGKIKSKRLAKSTFNLWHKYDSKVCSVLLAEKVVNCGERLFQAKEFQIAQDVCYGWLLMKHGIIKEGKCGDEECFAVEEGLLRPLLLATIGYCLVVYHRIRGYSISNEGLRMGTLALQLLERVTKTAVKQEKLFQILYNGNTLTHMFSVVLMRAGRHKQVLEYLLWGAVTMETCIPLMTADHLPLRTGLYCAVCKCYFLLGEPNRAEAFARKALGKVSELVQLQNKSTTPQTPQSERAYKEAAVKLGMIVFKRTVFESRKKTRSILRNKARPPLKDILTTAWPRAPTEKLLSEMFNGKSAYFQAILTALEDPSHQRAEQSPPHPTNTDLDVDTYLEVHLELVTAGADIAMKCLVTGGGEGKDSGSSISPQLSLEGSLMDMSVQGEDTVPVSSVVHFVHLLHSYEYTEAYSLLYEHLYHVLKDCEAVPLKCHLKVLEIVKRMDYLKHLKLEAQFVSQETSSAFLGELVDTAELLASCLDLPILESEHDLLRSASTFLWEQSLLFFNGVTSHHSEGCSSVNCHPLKKKLLHLLSLLHNLLNSLSAWSTDVQAVGEVTLKLVYLLENRATAMRPDLSEYDTAGVDKGLLKCLSFDRGTLLEALCVVDAGLRGIDTARNTIDLVSDSSLIRNVELLHVELLGCLLRLKVKLSSTSPPDLAAHGKNAKLSSLKNKVEEQKKLNLKQSKLLALITAPQVKTPTRDELHSECGRNAFLTALLLIQEVVVSKEIDIEEETTATWYEDTLQKALTHLQAVPLVVPTVSRREETEEVLQGGCPPPPILIGRCDGNMTFIPPSFKPSCGEKVQWYALYGRSATGSNVKVRLNDNTLPGLGIPVPVGDDCKLTVSGLRSNETYVFAVAGYTQDGRLVGDSIGETGRPTLCAHPMPALAGYVHLCKSAYEVGSLEVAKAAGEVMWSYFMEEVPESSTGNGTGQAQYRLRSDLTSTTSHQLLAMLVKCVFILVDVRTRNHSISYTALEVDTAPYIQQSQRLELCEVLLVAVELGRLLRDPEVLMQSVVTCYGILTPLIQYDLMTESLGEIVLKCLHILKELPKETISRHTSEIKEQIHHMIAVIAYQGLKTRHKSHVRGHLGQLAGSVKDLLAVTLVPSKAPQPGGHPSTAEKTSTKKKAFSHSAEMNQSLSNSLNTSQRPRRVHTADLKSNKRKSKRVAPTTTAVTEELKSDEMKALEAFFATWRAETQDQELTGQEDITLLYGTISTEPVAQAYKEVRKFRRRPRYLEFFVHLCKKAVEGGHFESIVEWSKEVLSWLKRRNELLMQLRAPRLSKREPATLTGDQARYTLAVQKYTEKPKSHVMRHHSRLAVKPVEPLALKPKVKSGDTSHEDHHSSPRRGSKTVGVVEEGKVVSLKPDTSKALLVSVGHIHITKDDLVLKAKSVLTSLLVDLYRQASRRRRLRMVTVEEYPWRAQLHLLLAHSHLDHLSSHLRPHLLQRSGVGGALNPSLLLLNNTGVLMGGVLERMVEVRPPPNKEPTPEEVRSDHKSMHGLPTIREKPSQDNMLHEDKQEVLDEQKQEMFPIEEKQEVLPSVDIQEEVSPRGRAETSSEGEHDHEVSTGKEKHTADKSPRSKPEKKESSLPQELEGLPEIITDFRKAIVLSHRGRLWVLLQNVCRDMYSSLSNLSNLLVNCPTLSTSSEVLIGCLYSHSARTLYMGSRALIDMVEALEDKGLDLVKQFTDINTGHPGNDFISSLPVDLEFVVRFVLLSLQVLFRSRLWERLVDVCCAFNHITSYRYIDLTSPLLKHSQQELMVRMTSNQLTRKMQSLHPAAHLDPAEYNVYGCHGNALGVTSLNLAHQETEEKVTDKVSSSSPETLLGNSRELLSRFLKSQFLPDTGSPVPPEVGSLSPSSAHCIIESYMTTVKALKERKEWFLSAVALHELGMVYCYQGDRKLASSCWIEGLNTVLRTKDALKLWKSIFKSHKTALEKFGYQGLWSALVLVGRLVKYVYVNELDIRLEYAMLAANLVKSLLSDSLTQFDYDVSFLLLPTGESDPLRPALCPKGGDLFGLTSQCVMESLYFVAKVLVQRKYYHESCPVLHLHERFAFSVCRSVEQCVWSGVLAIRAMTGLHVFSQAITRMKALLVGGNLPQDHTHCARPPEHQGHGRGLFNDSLPITDAHNFKVLAHLLDKQLPPSLSTLYGPQLVSELSITRANLYVALANNLPGLPSLSTLRRRGVGEVSRPTTALSSYIGSHLDRASSPGSSVASAPGRNHTTQMASQSPEPELRVPPSGEIKSTLLRHAESIILSVASQQENKDHIDVGIMIQCYLAMSELGLVQHTPTVAANCALAGFRLIQENGNGSGNHDLSHEYVSPLMWLECRQRLAWSLVHLHTHPHPPTSPLSLQSVCKEGISEAESSGIPEVVAVLKWCLAIHTMNHEQSDTSKAISLLEASLKSLESARLTAQTRLLRSEVSFHLATLLLSTSGQATPNPSVVGVCKEVISYLTSEVDQLCTLSHSSPPSHNIYLPHHDLLAQCQLVVGHSLLAGQQYPESIQVLTRGLENCRQSHRRRTLLEAQLLYNLSVASAHESKNNLSPPLDYLQSSVWMCEVIAIASRTNILHILCEATYASMAGMFCVRSTSSVPPPLPSSTEKKPKATSLEKERPSSKLSRPVSETECCDSSAGGDRRASGRKWQKERNIDAVISWCCMQALRLTQLAKKRLEDTTRELGRQDLNKLLGNKSLSELSDGILLSLIEGDHSFPGALGSECVPLSELAPSSQCAPSTSTSWRKVLVYLSELRERAYPGTHHHTAAYYNPPLAYWWADECDCIHKVLSENLSALYDDCVVPLLPRFVVDHFTKTSAKHQLPPPGTTFPVPTQAQVEKWYGAPEPQVNIHWQSTSSPSSQVKGIAAVNLKAVKHMSSFTMGSTSEIHLLCINRDSTKLQHVRDMLNTCVDKAKEISSTQSAKSRKSSSMKHSIPPDVQPLLINVLSDLCNLCNKKLEEISCPAVPVEALSQLCSVLERTSRVVQAKKEVCSLLAIVAKATPQTPLS